MAVDERRLPAALLAVTLVWCLALALLGAHDGLLFLVPALLLAAPLAARRYPGEEVLHALASRPRSTRRRAAARRFAPAVQAAWLVPRGALLIATSLAKRGPPLLLARS
jgi:hypothetical protein